MLGFAFGLGPASRSSGPSGPPPPDAAPTLAGGAITQSGADLTITPPWATGRPSPTTTLVSVLRGSTNITADLAGLTIPNFETGAYTVNFTAANGILPNASRALSGSFTAPVAAPDVPAASLRAAITTAVAGDVIYVAAGAPLDLNLNGVAKSDPGVTIVFPPEQVFSIIASGLSNIHIRGGKCSANIAKGISNLNTNWGIRLADSSKFSIAGTYFTEGKMGISMLRCFDVVIQRNLFADHFNDAMNASGMTRGIIENNETTLGAKSEKMCFFDDGRQPIDGISAFACVEQGGEWRDAAHTDGIQVLGSCADILIKGNTFRLNEAQGVVAFGVGSSFSQRIQIEDNLIENASGNSINFTGDNILVIDNQINDSPDVSVKPRLALARFAVADRVAGGRNIVGPNIPVTNPAGVDLVGAGITGDTITPPTPPIIAFPTGTPASVLPPVPPVGLAGQLTKGAFRFIGELGAGTYLSIFRGSWTDAVNPTWEYRFYKDGVLIPGATSRVFQIPPGYGPETVLHAEVRAITAAGTSPWGLIKDLLFDGIPSVTELRRETDGSVTVLSLASVEPITIARQPNGSVTIG